MSFFGTLHIFYRSIVSIDLTVHIRFFSCYSAGKVCLWCKWKAIFALFGDDSISIETRIICFCYFCFCALKSLALLLMICVVIKSALRLHDCILLYVTVYVLGSILACNGFNIKWFILLLRTLFCVLCNNRLLYFLFIAYVCSGFLWEFEPW